MSDPNCRLDDAGGIDLLRMSPPPLAFYSVSGRDFFPGAVALVNSLRLVGHTDPVFVLDCGMDPDQREHLSRVATVLPAPADAAPSLLKLAAPLAHPAEAMVVLDADMIATRRLDEPIEQARNGRLVAFENESQRYFEEWGALLGLGALRRGPYLSSGAIFAGGETGRELFSVIAEKQAALEPERTWLGGGDEADPLFYADQDILNAVALARLRPEQVVALESRLGAIPPFTDLRLLDAGTLRCAHADGTEPYLLHHYFRKPWLVAMRSNVYSRLLTRLLLSEDVAIRLDPARLPRRLRTGRAAAASRLAVDVGVGGPAALRRRLGRRPRRIEAWRDRR
jgi:hypothetical protein